MASKKRSQKHSIDSFNDLHNVIQESGHTFDFHALVRLLETFMRAYGKHGVGERASPHEESVRFRARISMEFPRSDVLRAVLDTKESSALPAFVETSFFALAGLQGPLPVPYTQRVLERMREHDFAMRDFLDMFHTRLLALLHRVRKTYWVGVSSDLPEDTALGMVLKSFIGENSWIKDQAIPLRSVLSMSLCFWQKPRSADLLRMLLSLFLCTQVRIELYQSGWRQIASGEQTILGKQYHALGKTLVLGSRMRDTGYSFTIIIGPVTMDRYASMLPGKPVFHSLENLVKSFLGIHQHYRIKVLWQASQAPLGYLGEGMRLGLTAWLWRQPGPVACDSQTIMASV